MVIKKDLLIKKYIYFPINKRSYFFNKKQPVSCSMLQLRKFSDTNRDTICKVMLEKAKKFCQFYEKKKIPYANLVEFRILEYKHVNVYFLLFLGQNYKIIKTFYFAKK